MAKQKSYPITNLELSANFVTISTMGALAYCHDNQSQMIDNPINNALCVTVSWQRTELVCTVNRSFSKKIYFTAIGEIIMYFSVISNDLYVNIWVTDLKNLSMTNVNKWHDWDCSYKPWCFMHPLTPLCHLFTLLRTNKMIHIFILFHFLNHLGLW